MLRKILFAKRLATKFFLVEVIISSGYSLLAMWDSQTHRKESDECSLHSMGRPQEQEDDGTAVFGV